jgi:hypothetical protein
MIRASTDHELGMQAFLPGRQPCQQCRSTPELVSADTNAGMLLAVPRRSMSDGCDGVQADESAHRHSDIGDQELWSSGRRFVF